MDWSVALQKGYDAEKLARKITISWKLILKH